MIYIRVCPLFYKKVKKKSAIYQTTLLNPEGLFDIRMTTFRVKLRCNFFTMKIPFSAVELWIPMCRTVLRWL